MKNFLSLLFICTLSIQCAGLPKEVKNTAHLPQIIFVPGYYGSYLKRVKDNKRVWFTAGQALWGDQTLALTGDGIQVPDVVELVVDGVFNSLELIPGIMSKDIYGDTIATLEKNFLGQANIVPFAYDWRQDITHSSQQLAQLVDNLYAQGAPKVAIVSHSMGGLITSYYLLYGKQNLENARPNLYGAKKLYAVVMAATPFQGTMTVFRNMQFGVQFGVNKKALENYAVASFPSSYQLLPQYPESLLSESGENHSDWIFKEGQWRKHGWSLFRNASELNPAILLNRRKFTQKMLLLGKTTYKKIHEYKINSNSAVPFLYFYNDETPTINQALWDQKEQNLLFPGINLRNSLKNYDQKQLLSKGDGTVTEKSAQPPEQFATTFPNLQIRNRVGEHLEILKQEKTINEMVRFLQKALNLRSTKPVDTYNAKMNDPAASGQPSGWTQYSRAMGLRLFGGLVSKANVCPTSPPRVAGQGMKPTGGK